MTRDPVELADLHARYAETRHAAIRGELVGSYRDLVTALSRRFTGRGESHEDLVQVGFVGLLQAIDRFDPARGVPFLAYAVPTVPNASPGRSASETIAVAPPKR